MKKLKQRIVTLLIACLLAPMFLASMPQLQMEVQAASKSVYWNCISDSKAAHPTTTGKIVVEQGQKFDLSDWIEVNYYKNNTYTSTTAHTMKPKCSSNKKSIVSITKKGVVTTKKKGTAVVTVKVAGEKLTCTIKVVGKGKLTAKVKNSKKINKELEALAKYSDTKLTDKVLKEEYSLMKKVFDYTGGDSYSEWNKIKIKHYFGLVYEKNKWVTNKNELAMPNYATYMRLRTSAAEEIKKASPVKAAATGAYSLENGSGAITLTAPLTMAQYLKTFYGEYVSGSMLGSYSSCKMYDVTGTELEEVSTCNNSKLEYFYVNMKLVPGQNKIAITTKSQVNPTTGVYSVKDQTMLKGLSFEVK